MPGRAGLYSGCTRCALYRCAPALNNPVELLCGVCWAGTGTDRQPTIEAGWNLVWKPSWKPAREAAACRGRNRSAAWKLGRDRSALEAGRWQKCRCTLACSSSQATPRALCRRAALCAHYHTVAHSLYHTVTHSTALTVVHYSPQLHGPPCISRHTLHCPHGSAYRRHLRAARGRRGRREDSAWRPPV